MDDVDNREGLYKELSELERRHSTTTVVFHHALSEAMGLSSADHKYLDLVANEGAVPAGRLAEMTGLTTGAVTGLIDRLEKAGLVRRVEDPSDRRRVIVEPLIDEAMRRVGPVFARLSSDLRQFHDTFSEEELRTILNYLSRSSELLQRITRELRSG